MEQRGIAQPARSPHDPAEQQAEDKRVGTLDDVEVHDGKDQRLGDVGRPEAGAWDLAAGRGARLRAGRAQAELEGHAATDGLLGDGRKHGDVKKRHKIRLPGDARKLHELEIELHDLGKERQHHREHNRERHLQHQPQHKQHAGEKNAALRARRTGDLAAQARLRPEMAPPEHRKREARSRGEKGQPVGVKRRQRELNRHEGRHLGRQVGKRRAHGRKQPLCHVPRARALRCDGLPVLARDSDVHASLL